MQGNKEMVGLHMVQKMANFKEALEFGEEGEKEVALFLMNKGYTVLPLYQFNKEHAPFLLSRNGKITLPDLDCYHKTKASIFVEVKSKNQWNVTNKIIETGFDLKHFKEYVKIQDKTNKEVWVVFNHKGKDEGMYIVNLNKFYRKWDGKNNKGQIKSKALIFYKKEDLQKIK